MPDETTTTDAPSSAPASKVTAPDPGPFMPCDVCGRSIVIADKMCRHCGYVPDSVK